MDLKLKSLKEQLESCNDKLEVIDYIYHTYDNYLDDDLKHYLNQSHSLIEVAIMELTNKIDETYKELEDYIMEHIDYIQADIDTINERNKILGSFSKKLLPYIFHYHMLCDENSIYYSVDSRDVEDAYLEELKEEFGIE